MRFVGLLWRIDKLFRDVKIDEAEGEQEEPFQRWYLTLVSFMDKKNSVSDKQEKM